MSKRYTMSSTSPSGFSSGTIENTVGKFVKEESCGAVVHPRFSNKTPVQLHYVRLSDISTKTFEREGVRPKARLGESDVTVWINH